MKRNEAKLDERVLECAIKRFGKKSFALEVKITGGKLKSHQKSALYMVHNEGFGFKIPDMGKRNPFDYFYLPKGTLALVGTINPKNGAITIEKVTDLKI
jgi:hypothetical protein